MKKGTFLSYKSYYLFTFVSIKNRWNRKMVRPIYRVVLWIICLTAFPVAAQIDTDRVMSIGRNALYFEDYVLSIQYFNQVIKVKPYWADPYFYRAIAKLNLDDLRGAEEDATACLERNPYMLNAYQVRGVARQNMDNFDGAIADYKQGLVYAPHDRALLNNLAIAEVQAEHYEAADTAYAALFEQYPSYAPAYLSRSQFYLMRGDTVAARSDVDRAIELDKNMAAAYGLRTHIRMKHDADYAGALADMNEAVKLEPKSTAVYINRALVKYYMDDLRGAMADYDYVLMLDPSNTMTHYNRGLLRMQVGDRNRAIDDFSAVLLREPDNYFALYNRAILYDMLGLYDKAISDYDAVLEVYPDYIGGLYARSEAKRKNGDIRGGELDYNKAFALQEDARRNPEKIAEAAEQAVSNAERKASDKNINKFDRLLVADNDENSAFTPKYENKVRGRVQDRNVRVSMQPMFALNYYERPNELRPSNFFSDELDRLNDLRVYPRRLVLTNDEALLTTSQINEHFISISKYTRSIDDGQSANPLAYFGRALDFMLIQDYASALDDLDRVIELSPQFMLAYFVRSVVRYKYVEYRRTELAEEHSVPSGGGTVAPILASSVALDYELIEEDLNRVIELSPRFFYAYYNRGNLHFAQQEIQQAIADYTEALRLQPDLADAYFNRGLAWLKAGDEVRGREDLSKAGELGVMAAYNLLKRMGD